MVEGGGLYTAVAGFKDHIAGGGGGDSRREPMERGGSKNILRQPSNGLSRPLNRITAGAEDGTITKQP